MQLHPSVSMPPGRAVMQPKEIKLLQFVSNFAIGGTERQLVNLAQRLDSNRFDLYLGCLRRAGEFLSEVKAHRIPVVEYHINSLRNYGTLKEQYRFAGYLKRNRIRVVHTYGFYPNVFAIPAARLARSPVIIASVRDTGEMWTPAQRRVMKFVCRLAHCVVVNAEAVAERLIAEGYDREKMTVIGNGIDLSRFARNGGGLRLRRELSLAPEAPLIAVFSRLNPLKGVEYFLEAAAIVAPRFPEARFLVVGGPMIGEEAYQRELERLVDRLGFGNRVLFTGFRVDVPELLSEVTISVLPSLSEGLSNVLLESMAAGVPAVATKVGGNPEAVEHGVTGLLVPPRNPSALAQAISRLLENPEMGRSFGAAGRQRVAERFSVEKMVRETERLYLKLLEKVR